MRKSNSTLCFLVISCKKSLKKTTQFEEKRLEFNDFTSHWPDLCLFPTLKSDLITQFRLMKSAGNSRLRLNSSESLLESTIQSVKGAIAISQELETLLIALQSCVANVVATVQERGRTLLQKCSFCQRPNKSAKCSSCQTINWAQIFQSAARSQTPERLIPPKAIPSPFPSPICTNCNQTLPAQSTYCTHCNSDVATRLCSMCNSVAIHGPSGRCKECSKRSQTPSFVYSQRTVEVCPKCRRDLKGKKGCDFCRISSPMKTTR